MCSLPHVLGHDGCLKRATLAMSCAHFNGSSTAEQLGEISKAAPRLCLPDGLDIPSRSRVERLESINFMFCPFCCQYFAIFINQQFNLQAEKNPPSINNPVINCLSSVLQEVKIYQGHCRYKTQGSFKVQIFR